MKKMGESMKEIGKYCIAGGGFEFSFVIFISHFQFGNCLLMYRRHGRWHGFGTASFSNGDSYEGGYRFDQRHGKGIYKWHDGRTYDGEFLEDKRHGKGKFTWPDGAVYIGDFVNGQREGKGKYIFADGGQYEGSWKVSTTC